MDEKLILTELKSLIVSKAGIRTITPSDCKRISIEISKTLNKNVSETTIKRLFGFAVVKHNFSKFTLTTLSEYVNEERFINNGLQMKTNTTNSQSTWKDIHINADRITNFTIKGIKNRSGMPYEMTISRKFAEHDFEDFFNSNFSFTCFISHPGYGRTILLSHLAELFTNHKLPVYKESTMLFITAYSFFNKDHISLSFEDQLKLQLGIHQRDSLLEYANKNYHETGGKLVIVIDGFSELVLKRDFKKQLFESIINFICTIEDNQSIKLVMSMRSTTWIRFHECFRRSSFLKTKWFPGSYFNFNDVSNVPPLTEKEIDHILSKIHNLSSNDVNELLKTHLKFPFHIQLYHQLKEEDPQFNYSTNITFYELTSRFIQEKIYKSNYYTEKILFLKKVIQLTNFGTTGGESVLKDDLIGELSAFKNAYMELLSDGILMEEKSNEQVHPKEFVRFVHPHIFEYFLFTELLEKFHLRIDQDFFDYIKKEYSRSQSWLQILQWTVRFIIRTGDMSALTCIFDIELHNYERGYLILFIAENLDYRSKNSTDTVKLLNEHNLHKVLIGELTKLDLIDSRYKDSIEVLLRVADKDEDLLTYNILLAIFDVFSLDPQKIKSRIIKLESIHASELPINIIDMLRWFYAGLMNKPCDIGSLTNPINKFIDECEIASQLPQTSESYLLLALIGIFHPDNASFSSSLSHVLSENTEINHEISLLMLAFSGYGLMYSLADQEKRSRQLNMVLDLLNNKSKFRTTRYSECIINVIKAYLLKSKGKYVDAYNYCIEPLHLFKTNKLNINCLITYNLIIEIFTESRELERANEFRYEKLCFIEENNIPNSAFLNNHLFKKANNISLN